jgi:YD repeat-containing protein
MCRIFGMVSHQKTRASVSLIDSATSLREQSLKDAASNHHPDGWGIGYYDDEGNPIVEKEPNWAVSSYRYQELARSVSFRIGLAHVRRATAGAVSPLHTHPFKHDTWLLAQNGGLGLRWHARMGAALGVDLDTAVDRPSGKLLLSWLHQRAAHLAGAEQTVAIIDGLRELVSDDAEITAANFVLTTPNKLYAFRYAPRSASSYTLRVDARGSGEKLNTVVVASEATRGGTWEPLQDGELLVAELGQTVRAVVVPIAGDGRAYRVQARGSASASSSAGASGS